MTGTRFLTTAYHESMEMAILLFLLAMSGGDSSQLKEKLSSALAFYRENRELIAMLASGGGNLFGGAPAPQSAQTPQENQPAAGQTEENPNIKILEEFLKARTV